MSALFDDSTVLQHHEEVGIPEGAEPVRDAFGSLSGDRATPPSRA
ncbi:hypothetical protein [Streptomyces sp. CB01580]